MLKKTKALVAGAALSVAAVPAFAQTTTIPDGTASLTGLVTSQAAYSTVMYGLAAAAVGIMIAVKWIKRGRGAA